VAFSEAIAGRRKLGRGVVRRRRFLGRVEPLEERALLADLYGSYFFAHPIFSLTAAPGGFVEVDWSVSNSQFDTIETPFVVGFYLARGNRIDAANSRLLESVTLPFGFPGFYSLPTQTTTLTLPAASDPIWAGTGRTTSEW
jgi:hypothetical protein